MKHERSYSDCRALFMYTICVYSYILQISSDENCKLYAIITNVSYTAL